MNCVAFNRFQHFLAQKKAAEEPLGELSDFFFGGFWCFRTLSADVWMGELLINEAFVN